MSGCYNCEHYYQHPCQAHPFCKYYIASIIDPWEYCEAFDDGVKVRSSRVHQR